MTAASQKYIGRFAPSPTGPVHFGTLVAAVGSYLQAMSNHGEWLLRIDDVDTTRKVEGADVDIIRTLEAFGFEWAGDILYQTQLTASYEAALNELIEQSLVFPCLCSRKQLAQAGAGAGAGNIYPGTCRSRRLPESEEHSLRLMAEDITITFDDIVMGRQSQNIKTECGDFIIKRRDGLFAYQLAVVVDDAIQNITEVVRGTDLLNSTPRQIYLQRLLGYPTPTYCHLPLAVDPAGNKISKSEGKSKIEIAHREELLIFSLDFLGQQVPGELNGSGIEDIWQWAMDNWDVARIPTSKTIPL